MRELSSSDLVDLSKEEQEVQVTSSFFFIFLHFSSLFFYLHYLSSFPGVFFIIPCLDVYEKIDMRTSTYDVPPQEV